MNTKAALLLRVSTEEQNLDNQRDQLIAWAEAQTLEVGKVWEAQESAWQGAYLRQLGEIYEAASRREFQVLLVWSLDRLSRQGPRVILEIIHRLGTYGVEVRSYQEAWINVSGDLRDLLLAIAGWVAQMESKRISERTKAGLARRKAEGLPVGRQPGAVDKKKRKRRAYG